MSILKLRIIHNSRSIPDKTPKCCTCLNFSIRLVTLFAAPDFFLRHCAGCYYYLNISLEAYIDFLTCQMHVRPHKNSNSFRNLWDFLQQYYNFHMSKRDKRSDSNRPVQYPPTQKCLIVFQSKIRCHVQSENLKYFHTHAPKILKARPAQIFL